MRLFAIQYESLVNVAARLECNFPSTMHGGHFLEKVLRLRRCGTVLVVD
jgi:hypothetical protein